jgi:hypothetical protein
MFLIMKNKSLHGILLGLTIFVPNPRTIDVTNLNDSGPGSLREAVEEFWPRRVVFKVGGEIHLKSKLIVKNPYLIIDGSDAPGEGITLRDYTFGVMNTHDVIVKYIRIRLGDTAKRTMDAAGITNSNRVLFDHCSISWGIDESLSTRRAKNIEVSRCIISETLNFANHDHYIGTEKGHSFAASISGLVGHFHHNLLAHNAGRNWSLAGEHDKNNKVIGEVVIENNVIYNWKHRTLDGEMYRLRFARNYYKSGPATTFLQLYDPEKTLVNYFEQESNFLETRTHLREGPPANASGEEKKEALDTYDSVLADVGCNKPKLDEIDTRIIREVRTGTFTFRGSKSGLSGIIDSQKDVGQ